MKKIINGKKYDTETARMVGCFVWEKNKEDVNYSVEILFCKKTGEYFLYEEDNIISEYYISGRKKVRQRGQNEKARNNKSRRGSGGRREIR